MPKKEKPPRKIPKKSQRPKRRYILFSLKQGSCKTAKQAFDLVMGCFSPGQKKELGIWFIGFNPATGTGILRCCHSALPQARKVIESISPNFGPKTLRSSGTLLSLKERMK